MMNFRKYYLSIVLFCSLSLNANSQHYFVIESESQQPFYLKLADTIYSSSGSGFMIVPRNMEKKLSCTIGFPRNKYPEIHFELDSMDRDRGFYLRQFEGKGWGLFDRASMEVVIGKVSGTIESSTEMVQSKKGGDEFATMLSEVTGDKTLLERPTLPVKGKAVEAGIKKVTEKIETVDTIKVVNTVDTKPTVAAVVKEVDRDTSSKEQLRITYIDSMAQGVIDTIDMQIDVKQVIVKETQKLDSPILVTNKCLFNPASESDLKTIQRKLLGFKDAEGSLSYLKKAYGNKCFTAKQTLEISWFLSDETVRLGFYELVMPLLSDHQNVMMLEGGLMLEGNINAFKALVSKNSSN
jgi:hypothetical protein